MINRYQKLIDLAICISMCALVCAILDWIRQWKKIEIKL